MPANLTPQYRKAEEAFRKATTAAERIDALEDMLRLIPKHKGTEHIQADLKRRLAKARQDDSPKQGKGGHDIFHIEKHGAGQVLVLGMPNSGKSALVAAVTKARVHVAAYPFATHAPIPGMMPFEDIQVQVVDMPPFSEDGMMPGMLGALRAADTLTVCLDIAADDLLEQTEAVFAVMQNRGLFPEGTEQDDVLFTKPMIILGTKADVPGALDNLDILLELRPDLASLLPVSAESGQGLQEFAEKAFTILDVIRVYSKIPGKQPDMDEPFVLPRGSTLVDMARAVHRDIAEELRYARIWGSGKFDGQTVNHEHILEDGDIIELHV